MIDRLPKVKIQFHLRCSLISPLERLPLQRLSQRSPTDSKKTGGFSPKGINRRVDPPATRRLHAQENMLPDKDLNETPNQQRRAPEAGMLCLFSLPIVHKREGCRL